MARRLRGTPRSTPARAIWPASPSSQCAAMREHDPPDVKPSSAAVAFLAASGRAQGQAQTQTAAQNDLHHLGWERVGPVHRHCCQPGRRLLAGLGEQDGPVGLFQGRQRHAVADVVGTSTLRMKLPTVWPVTGPSFPCRAGRRHVVREGSPSWTIAPTIVPQQISCGLCRAHGWAPNASACPCGPWPSRDVQDKRFLFWALQVHCGRGSRRLGSPRPPRAAGRVAVAARNRGVNRIPSNFMNH